MLVELGLLQTIWLLPLTMRTGAEPRRRPTDDASLGLAVKPSAIAMLS
jgi:hypothetical protein